MWYVWHSLSYFALDHTVRQVAKVVNKQNFPSMDYLGHNQKLVVFHLQLLWKLHILVTKKHLFTSVHRSCSAHRNSEDFFFVIKYLAVLSKDTSETLFRVVLKLFSRDFLFSGGIGNLQRSRQCRMNLIWSTRAGSCSNTWWISLRYGGPVLYLEY